MPSPIHDPAAERLRSEPLDESRGVRNNIACEAAAGGSAESRKRPAQGRDRVEVQRVESGGVHGGLEQQPLHAIRVAQRIALCHVRPVVRSDDGEPIEAQLIAQQLDVLHRVGRPEEAAPVSEQGRAGRRLAPGIGLRGGLEVTAAQGARAGPALVEHDQVATRNLPAELAHLCGRLARRARQQQGNAALGPVEGLVELHPQRQPAGHGSAVVERHREPRAAARPRSRGSAASPRRSLESRAQAPGP